MLLINNLEKILPIINQFCCVSLYAYIGEYKYVSVVSPCFGFPDSSVGQESTCNAGDADFIPGLGGSTGERIGYPLQCCGLENSMDCIVHEVTKSWTRLSNFHFHFIQFKYINNIALPLLGKMLKRHDFRSKLE